MEMMLPRIVRFCTEKKRGSASELVASLLSKDRIMRTQGESCSVILHAVILHR
jgi:hypothetical protein